MEPVISLVAILSGAVVSLVSLWLNREHDLEDRRQVRADQRAERAIELYTGVEEVLRRMDPDMPEAMRPYVGSVETDELHAELEWLSVMGWTKGIRRQADETRSRFIRAETARLLFQIPVGTIERHKTEAELRDDLKNAIADAQKSVQQLRSEIRTSIE